MSESNSNVIPAINAVDGFNPADFVRTTVGEEGENDLYLDVKYRLLWFRLHHPNGKIDRSLSELMRRMQSYAAGSMPIRLTQLTSSLGSVFSAFLNGRPLWRSLLGDRRNSRKGPRFG